MRYNHRSSLVLRVIQCDNKAEFTLNCWIGDSRAASNRSSRCKPECWVATPCWKDESGHMHHTILVVDDDPQIRKLCRITLEECGYVVGESTNGKKALAAIEETSFDLVMLDLCMPDMDGLEFLKAVRARMPKFRIVGMSGFMGGTLLRAAKLYGADATVAKPFSPDSLLAVVAEVLAGNGAVEASD